MTIRGKKGLQRNDAFIKHKNDDYFENGLYRRVWEEALSLMQSLRTKKLCAIAWPLGKASMRNKSYAQNTKDRVTLKTQKTSPWIKCIKQSRMCHEWNGSSKVDLFRIKKTCRVILPCWPQPNLKWHSKITYNAIEIQRHWGWCAFFYVCRNLTAVISNCSFVVNLKEAVNIDMVLFLCTQPILGKTVSK